MKPTYLALGDSYTIGEGVKTEACWPVMLASAMHWQAPTIIAKTGWKTYDLLDALEHSKLEKQYDWVSLLIGVNNQYRSIDFHTFREDLNQLFQIVDALVNDSSHVVLVSIPDYSLTPYAQDMDHMKISAEIEQYNLYIEACATQKSYQFCDITDLSMRVGPDASMVVDDGLHPSALHYQLWVERLQDRCNF